MTRNFALLLQDISKRLSLPADMHLPERVLVKHATGESPLMGEGPLNRRLRRSSLVSHLSLTG